MGALSDRGKVRRKACCCSFRFCPAPVTLNPHRGFTLIELILVLVIMGFLTALIGPAITSLAGLTLKTSAKKVAAGLRYARSQAITAGVDYRVTFNLERGEMVIEPLDSKAALSRDEGFEGEGYRYRKGEVAIDEAMPLRLEERKVYTLPGSVTFSKIVAGDEEITEGEATLDFYPNGSCSGGEVFLEDERERSYRIDLDFLTGVVRIGMEEEE